MAATIPFDKFDKEKIDIEIRPRGKELAIGVTYDGLSPFRLECPMCSTNGGGVQKLKFTDKKGKEVVEYLVQIGTDTPTGAILKKMVLDYEDGVATKLSEHSEKIFGKFRSKETMLDSCYSVLRVANEYRGETVQLKCYKARGKMVHGYDGEESTIDPECRSLFFLHRNRTTSVSWNDIGYGSELAPLITINNGTIPIIGGKTWSGSLRLDQALVKPGFRAGKEDACIESHEDDVARATAALVAAGLPIPIPSFKKNEEERESKRAKVETDEPIDNIIKDDN